MWGHSTLLLEGLQRRSEATQAQATGASSAGAREPQRQEERARREKLGRAPQHFVRSSASIDPWARASPQLRNFVKSEPGPAAPLGDVQLDDEIVVLVGGDQRLEAWLATTVHAKRMPFGAAPHLYVWTLVEATVPLPTAYREARDHAHSAAAGRSQPQLAAAGDSRPLPAAAASACAEEAPGGRSQPAAATTERSRMREPSGAVEAPSRGCPRPAADGHNSRLQTAAAARVRPKVPRKRSEASAALPGINRCPCRRPSRLAPSPSRVPQRSASP
mmetsp:Transcript_27311/g.88118  ORF Transcript_27311/g.88118 Transcript_27311/m.88118 type:complete len:275 (-) Transcript_27311:4432-5256(-)